MVEGKDKNIVDSKEKENKNDDGISDELKRRLRPLSKAKQQKLIKFLKNQVNEKRKEEAAKAKTIYRGIGDVLQIMAFNRNNEWEILEEFVIDEELSEKYRIPLIIEIHYVKKGKKIERSK